VSRRTSVRARGNACLVLDCADCRSTNEPSRESSLVRGHISSFCDDSRKRDLSEGGSALVRAVEWSIFLTQSGKYLTGTFNKHFILSYK